MGHKRSVEVSNDHVRKIFKSVKEAANYIGVTGSAVTHGVLRNHKVKGYNINVVHDLQYQDEIWRSHPNGFECSNFGRFRKGTEIYIGSISKRDGYTRCRIGGKTYLMHICIMECFDPFNQLLYELLGETPQVDHINSNRSDNHIDNLRWVNRSENMKYAKNKLTNLS